MTENPSLLLGVGVFSLGAIIMATLSLRQTNNNDFGKLVDEWNYEEEIQDAEMVDSPKTKTRKKSKK